MLKVEFHSHTNYIQKKETSYGPKELIDRACELGYDVLCITEHYWPGCSNPEYRQDPLQTYVAFKDYAEEKGLLLVPAVEFFFKEGEVLLINYTGDVRDLNDIRDLDNLPDDVVKIAPHPYFKAHNCLGKHLVEHIDLFDGIEYSFFYLNYFNLNKKAAEVAKKHDLPLFGTSDLHDLKWFGYSYTMVDCEKNLESLVKAIKAKKVQCKSQPLPLSTYMYAMYFHTLKNPEKLFFKFKEVIKRRIAKSP